MSVRCYRVKDVAEIAKVSVRTLHHYHEIELLVPSGRSEAGYRLYSDEDLQRLHQILVWRELGFPLERIRRVLDDPDFDRRTALVAQRRELSERARHTEAMIRSVDRALEIYGGGEKVNARELFDGFDPAQYEDEARERWGESEAYKESLRRTKRYTKQDWTRIMGEGNTILVELTEKMRQGAEPTDEEVLALAERHRAHIERWFYPCSREMHVNLAELYVADERFTANIDKHGEGLARFLAEAIRANAARD